MKRAWYILAIAAALAWGAREAQALVIGIQATWANPTEHLSAGSIVQVVVYNSSQPAPSPTDASVNFVTYSNGDPPVYLPDTVGPDLGHEIAYTGHVSEQGGKYVFKEYIDIDPQYDRIYIRVFEQTEFSQGEATQSWWGISDPQTIVSEAGLGFSWFTNVALTNQNYFEVIPEPGTAWLMLCGFGGMGLAGFRGKTRQGRTKGDKR